LESAKISLALVFATKIFLETRRVLRDSYSKSINDLTLSSLHMLKIIDTHRTAIAAVENRESFWLEEMDEELWEMEKSLKLWVNLEPMPSASRPSTELSNGHIPRYLEINPRLAGMFLFCKCHQLNDIALNLANCWYALPPITYLYTLLNVSNLRDGAVQWPDMDGFIKMHGHQLILGSTPRIAEECHRRFLIASRETKPSDFAKGKRNKTPQRGSKVRGLETALTLMSIFYQQKAMDSRQICIRNTLVLKKECLRYTTFSQAGMDQEIGDSAKILNRQFTLFIESLCASRRGATSPV
jgi:hypothetical protein